MVQSNYSNWFNVLPATQGGTDTQQFYDFCAPLGLTPISQKEWREHIYQPFRDGPLQFDWHIMRAKEPQTLADRVAKERETFANMQRVYPIEWVENFDYNGLQRLAMENYIRANPIDWETEKSFWQSVDRLEQILQNVRTYHK